MQAHTQQNPPGCHEGVWSNGPTGLPPYEVLRLGLPANTGGLRGAREEMMKKAAEMKEEAEKLRRAAKEPAFPAGGRLPL